MSAIYQKADFYNAALDEMRSGDYPLLAARLAAGDVTVTQQIGAMAQMAAMLSYQIGLAQSETWIKARDNMVLADASMRGILPFGKPSVYSANFKNNGSRPIIINAGRRLLDNKGRVWIITRGITVNGGDTQKTTIEQYETRETVHTVTEYKNFYRIPIEKPNGYIADVKIRHSDGIYFKEQERFANTDADERVYTLMTDEMQNLYAMFGIQGKAGYVANIGEEITVVCRVCESAATLANATSLELEYIGAGDEMLEIFSDKQEKAGEEPPSVSQMRQMTDFPSLYDHNAVFLGEFAFLLNREIGGFDFLNVWNERIEEKARGANQDNVNTLFVSFVKDGAEKGEMQNQIKKAIAKADNSYKVKFVDAQNVEFAATVNMIVSSMHDTENVKRQVIEYLLARYGKKSEWARKGGENQRVNMQDTIKGLRENIAAFQDGIGDVLFRYNMPETRKPEMFCYLTANYIDFTVEVLP